MDETSNSNDDEKETDVMSNKALGSWELIKNELQCARLLFCEDYVLRYLLAFSGMTFCFALMFFLQIETSLRSYELLQEYIERKEVEYSFLDFYESNEFWSWDPDLFLLTVNTTIYAH